MASVRWRGGGEAAAAGHTLLPLQRCIFSDHLTLVLAYCCLVHKDDH